MQTSNTIEHTTPAGPDAVREGSAKRLHEMWATVGPAWGEHADYPDRRGARMTRRSRPAVPEHAALAAGLDAD